MARKVEVRILEYFPQLKRSSTWEDAWNTMVDNTEIEGSIQVTNTAVEKQVSFELFNHGQQITVIDIPYDDFVNSDTTFNFDVAFKRAFDYCIKYKLIRKPRKRTSTSSGSDKLTELRDERDRLTMRIYNWRKDGKDVTELLKQKEVLVARIKELV